jgi:hypothetical protein
MKHARALRAMVPFALVACAAGVQAAEWSDTSLGWRYGTRFAEPFGRNDIHKNIVSLTHASGYKFGTNFFNADVLLSDSRDPGFGTNAGAQEVYVVYRNTVDAGKVMGRDFKTGFIRSWGATLGFDLNSKNDAYSSKKRMLVAGPTLMLDVPGFANLSLLVLEESNAPRGVSDRYTYDTHGALELDWSTPFAAGPVPLAFEGYALWISSKGLNEFGGPTKPETHVDLKLMADVGAVTGIGKNTLKAGVAYEYWRNKFGNPTTAPGAGAGPGATARTPMVRVEYHF